MKMFYFFYACFFSSLAIVLAESHDKSGCLEREKALTLLETAEDLLSKAGDTFPSCNENLNSKNQSDCEGEKPLAYIEVSKKLISDVRKNFPKCGKHFEKDDKNVTKPIEKDDKNVTKPIEKEDKIIEDVKARNCAELLANGRNESGVYTIWPSETNATGKPLQVYCDMETDDGGWTMIQRRGTFSVQQNFYLDWESYKNGFGNLKEEFWLGNENIRVLCHKGCEIRFDLEDTNGEKGFAFYQNFALFGNMYRLKISGYKGNVGDCMKQHSDYDFSTKDKGMIERAKKFHGGWWYRDNDFFSNLNAVLQPGESSDDSAFWYTWKERKSMASVEMKVRPKKI